MQEKTTKDQLSEIGQTLERISATLDEMRARNNPPVSTMPPKRQFLSTMPQHQPGERFSLAREISPYRNK
jgi:hypothetical protein